MALTKQVREAMDQALADRQDEFQSCARCKAAGSIDDGCEASAICHHCAQEVAEILAVYLWRKDRRDRRARK